MRVIRKSFVPLTIPLKTVVTCKHFDAKIYELHVHYSLFPVV